MRHIKDFPAFDSIAIDDLRRKIVHGVLTESFYLTDPVHAHKAKLEGKRWPYDPCWIPASKWQDGKGFKKFRFKGHILYIHRAAYEAWNGPVPAGHLVDHLCRVRGCCQPTHLEAVTTKENILRGANRNNLLRNGQLPPHTMHPLHMSCAVQPDGFSRRNVRTNMTKEEIDNEVLTMVGADYERRIRQDRDFKRVFFPWDCDTPPPAPEGFEWQDHPDGFKVLNPIRKAPIFVPMESFEFGRFDTHIPLVHLPDFLTAPTQPSPVVTKPRRHGLLSRLRAFGRWLWASA